MRVRVQAAAVSDAAVTAQLRRTYGGGDVAEPGRVAFLLEFVKTGADRRFGGPQVSLRDDEALRVHFGDRRKSGSPLAWG